MAKYSSKPQTIGRPAEDVYAHLSDFSNYQEKLDMIPPEVRAKVGDVSFDKDSITIEAAPVGAITLNVVERVAPRLVALQASQSPVPLKLLIELRPKDADATEVVTSVDVDIPLFMRPMVGGKMQEAADKFGELIGSFFGSNA